MAQRKKKNPHTNDLHRAFGARIRYHRLKLGLSQEELAAHCNLDRAYVGGIERGERNPSLKNIAIIATALKAPISSLFEGAEATAPQTKATK